ncbi:MAG TPA: hypothetical protein VN962_02005 [Polyangia bacterium]|nr:hypothetical protein [Polyangia bacterium]
MRSKLLLCAALAGSCLFAASPIARAADPKGKGAKGSKAKTGDSLTDDKTISKQLQWEDSVMGPDDKKGELEKIARAQAINKAASEKAARDKEKADADAARQAAAAPRTQTSKRGGDVALPTVPDEAPKKVAEAPPPPPPVKHGDDKFIDKLLKDEPGAKKHKSVDDSALNDLLAVDKPSAKPKRKDDVDSLLSSADKAPPMPETHVKKELPEWAKPEIQSTPQPTPVALRPQPRKNDGVIRVVQGAATPARVLAPAPSHTPAVAARVPANNHRAGGSDDWSDPFASGPKKTVAARETRHSSDFDDDFTSSRRHPAPAAKPASRGSDDWSDPVKPAAKATGGSHRSAPAAKGKWKDPFTQDVTAKKPAAAPVAARTARPVAHPVKVASAGWGVLKKR